MDAKDQRIESALGARNDDANSKYAQSVQANSNKTYQEIGSNPLVKVDVQTARPCAIIGPDRVVPPQPTKDVYLKRIPVEPWPCVDSIYQHPPEYPYKPADYHPPRNISPRQTFQENMQRIMVPPTYASVKTNEEHSSRNPKLMPLEAKYCDVPYSISPISNEPKIVKNSEGPINNSAQHFPQHGWVGSGVNVRPLRPYGAPELFQYSEYQNCPGPRPISMIRPQRNVHEDLPQVYQDRLYHEANIRFKPYSTPKERTHQHPQPRYDYIANYPNTIHPHITYPTHKYEMHKATAPHPYPMYPQGPLKYLDRKMSASAMEKYARSSSQPVSFNQPFCNQNIPPTYGSISGNYLPNRAFPFSSDPTPKPMVQNRLYIDSSNAHKYYSSSENLYINDINRAQTIKNDVLYPTYPPINMHQLPPHHMYRKECSMKGYEHAFHYRNIEYSSNMNTMSRLPLHFSPQTMSESPVDNTSNDISLNLGNTQEDCGYVSQSSTASVRSIESGANKLSRDIYRRQNMSREALHMTNTGHKPNPTPSPKDKKGLDVRQFLQMWNEVDDEGNDSNKETSVQLDSSNYLGPYESVTNQEQLYVLDLVNVPNEELGKYDHIQKISKLPENIKGYNSIELLNQYEKLVELSATNHYSLSPSQSKQKDSHVQLRNNVTRRMQPRPISPLDVEAKISQSVIHKEVGCNFEIRPCSPQMLNVEVATPVHNVLGERLIEKLVNPVIRKSPMQVTIDDITKDAPLRNSPKVPSCKLISNQYPSPNIPDSLKSIYSLQDLESNSGVCLASLPRLDNDIELNFPEINQQFIDANKIDSVKISPVQDLPVLDTDNAFKNKSSIKNKAFISEHVNSGSESDKEVAKLSKYRKHKKNSLIAAESEGNQNLHLSLHRTDSVIIKNPENVKSQEEIINPSSHIPIDNSKTAISELLQDKESMKLSNKEFTETVTKSLNGYTSLNINDTAIDFSLNKNNESNHMHSPNILNDSVQSITELGKHLDIESQNNIGTDVQTHQHLQKKSASDNLTTLQHDALALCNVDSFTAQPIVEDNPVLPTVITHSNPKNNATDECAFTSDDIVLYDDLSIQNPNINHSSSMTISNHNLKTNDFMKSAIVENPVLEKGVAMQVDNLVSSTYSIKPISESQNGIEKNVTNEINEKNYCYEKKSTETDIAVSQSETDKLSSVDYLSTSSNSEEITNHTNKTYEPAIKENQIIEKVSEINQGKETKTVTEKSSFHKSTNEFLIPEHKNEDAGKKTLFQNMNIGIDVCPGINENTEIETSFNKTDKKISVLERENEATEEQNLISNGIDKMIMSENKNESDKNISCQIIQEDIFLPPVKNDETPSQITDSEIFLLEKENETEVSSLTYNVETFMGENKMDIKSRLINTEQNSIIERDTNEISAPEEIESLVKNDLKTEMGNKKSEQETIRNEYFEIFRPVEYSSEDNKPSEIENDVNNQNESTKVITDENDHNISMKKPNATCYKQFKDMNEANYTQKYNFVPTITRHQDSDKLVTESNCEKLIIDTIHLPNETEASSLTYNVEKFMGENKMDIKSRLINTEQNYIIERDTNEISAPEEIEILVKNDLKTEMGKNKSEQETIRNEYFKIFRPVEYSSEDNKPSEIENDVTNQNDSTKVITDENDLIISMKKPNATCYKQFKDMNEANYTQKYNFVPTITRHQDSDNLVTESNCEKLIIDTIHLPNCASRQNNFKEEMFSGGEINRMTINDFTFKKEIFSPWIQKLILHSDDGFRTLSNTNGEENKVIINFFHKNNLLQEGKDNLNNRDVEDDTLHLEPTFKTRNPSCLRNVEDVNIEDKAESLAAIEYESRLSPRNVEEASIENKADSLPSIEFISCPSTRIIEKVITEDKVESLPTLEFNLSPRNVEATFQVKRESKTSIEFVLDEKEENESEKSGIDVNSKDVKKQTTMKTDEILERIHTEPLTVENMVSEAFTENKVDETRSMLYNPQNINFDNLIKEMPSIAVQLKNNTSRRRALKRSLSESATTEYNVGTDFIREHLDKRFKFDKSETIIDSQALTDNYSNIIQSNRRNSISTPYNDQNVSFCILIDDDCVLAEESEDYQRICYTEIPDECLTTIDSEEEVENSELSQEISYIDSSSCNGAEAVNSKLNDDMPYEGTTKICDKWLNSEANEDISYYSTKPFQYDNELDLQNMGDRTIEESWVEDVACMETVFSDDIAEDIVISTASSPKESDSSEEDTDYTIFSYGVRENEHTNKVKHIYGNQMCEHDAQLVDKLYRTPQMEVNRTLVDREAQFAEEYIRYYDNESLEKVLSESNSLDINSRKDPYPSDIANRVPDRNKENSKNLYQEQESKNNSIASLSVGEEIHFSRSKSKEKDCLVHSCESSCDNLVTHSKDDNLLYSISSSPEVSSTTSEEKSSGIFLKLKRYKGSKISEVNEMCSTYNNKHSQSFDNYGLPMSRPLITKAAQKYIPPLKETIRDLKVKIRLPKQSLQKLQQLKKSKEESKIKTGCNKHYSKNLPQESPKKAKPKPKFEDVLKSIDEIQFKKHKEKHKKIKQSVPKLIIKKNENGAHFASTRSKETFNPDLTGRKWQPWVFLEKNNFIDKMALKQKFKAIYSHRKETYVLADSFRKYKAVSNTKFVISHPKTSDISSGKLKYTFRLTHS